MATLDQMVEHCSQCGVELEVGQIGLCSDCCTSQDALLETKTVVLANNSEGRPEFHTCVVSVTKDQFDRGVHYDLAKENAEYNGYSEPMMVFDQKDPAARQLEDVLSWL